MLDPGKRRTFEEHTSAFIKVIEYCHENRLFEPQIALIYTLIDQMAWLYRSDRKPDITSTAYIYWVNKYVLPQSKLPCSAEELWGARCAILHTGTAESKNSKIGKFRKIYYYYSLIPVNGSQIIEELDQRLDKNAVFLDVDQLRAAVINGIDRLYDEIDNNHDLAVRVNERLGKVLKYVPVPNE